MIILGIESSCDETAVAVYSTQKGILSNVLFSQTEAHKRYGGVVPEIASRAQLEKITSVTHDALSQADMTLKDIDAIAVTHKPGLPGSLLVGVCFAKALAYATHKKLIGVNHLEGHAFSAMIENTIEFPYLCLTASGGHTALYIIHGFGKYEVLGQTLDDAAGEAFDKVARMLNYPYPGGPIIEQLASQVQYQDFFKYPRLKTKDLNFSFSGIKTAVLYDLINKGLYDKVNKRYTPQDNDLSLKQQIASSLLACITDVFIDRIKRALKAHPNLKALAFVGGVACNRHIKQQLTTLSESYGLKFFAPSVGYCTDNGAMIAFVGAYKAQQELYADLSLDVF